MVSVGHDVACNIKAIAERHIVFDAIKYLCQFNRSGSCVWISCQMFWLKLHICQISKYVLLKEIDEKFGGE